MTNIVALLYGNVPKTDGERGERYRSPIEMS